MRIALVTIGSLGDVQPILALALGLRRAGHEVRVVTHAAFATLGRALGVDLRSTTAADPRRLLESEEGREVLAIRNPLRAWRGFASLAEAGASTLFADVLAGCEGVDALGYSGLGLFPGYAAAARLGVPYFAAHLIPTGPTHDFPSPLLPQGPAWVPGYNRASHALARWLVWRWFGPLTDRTRAEGRPVPRFLSPTKLAAGARASFFGISPAVVPQPAAWSSWAQFTGYWFLDAPSWEPPPDLLSFLECGPPPVVVGFGSMSGREPAHTTRIVVEALERAGARGLLLTGWGGLEARALPSTVHALDFAPHAWLYPRAAAVVHHGGAGTTASALRAGLPSVLVPFAFDQPFWAERVRRLGAGPAPVPERQLTPVRLAEAIRCAVEDPRMRSAARALGERIRAEDGVGTAVRGIEHALNHPGRAGA
jgi:UDP:flavonoid glycosyltransferase YjiC (YdhE family)